MAIHDLHFSMTEKKQLPEITARKQVAKSRLFAIEQVDLTFSNGEQRQYECMQNAGRGAVMVVPMLDANTLLLVREYCGGTHSYELGFPKGLIDQGESAEVAANRELKEEIGYGSDNLQWLSELMTAPTFFNSKMTVFIGTNLYVEKLVGDEPELLEIVSWPLHDYKNLLAQPDFKEARSVAALMLAVDQFKTTLANDTLMEAK